MVKQIEPSIRGIKELIENGERSLVIFERPCKWYSNSISLCELLDFPYMKIESGDVTLEEVKELISRIEPISATIPYTLLFNKIQDVRFEVADYLTDYVQKNKNIIFVFRCIGGRFIPFASIMPYSRIVVI